MDATVCVCVCVRVCVCVCVCDYSIVIYRAAIHAGTCMPTTMISIHNSILDLFTCRDLLMARTAAAC